MISSYDPMILCGERVSQFNSPHRIIEIIERNHRRSLRSPLPLPLFLYLYSLSYLHQIRPLYQPIQPSLTGKHEEVFYREMEPHELLRPYIFCYWELKTVNRLDSTFSYRVVADGCIDVFFSIDDPGESFVMGFSSKYTEFQLEKTFHYFGIRFLPTAFPQLFHVNASHLTNLCEQLEHVVPVLWKYLRDSIPSDVSRARVLIDRFFLMRLEEFLIHQDGRLYEAIEAILRSGGNLNVESDISAGISARQLRRLFLTYVGDTPKTFAQVVRFQSFLSSRPSVLSLRRERGFYDAGYYDQSHFVKEFRNFYGLTPSQALLS